MTRYSYLFTENRPKYDDICPIWAYINNFVDIYTSYAFMQKDRYNIDKPMKIQHTNSTFASSNTQADSSACKRAIFCPHTQKTMQL